MTKESISINISPQMMERLGDDVEIVICVKGEHLTSVRNGKVNATTDKQDGDMLAYMREAITKKNEAGKLRTSETYQATMNRWRDFLKDKGITGDTPLPWTMVTASLIEDFVVYLRQRETSKNTQSFYCRILRAICNSARKKGYAVADNLFRNIYTGKAKTRKRALRMDDIQRIANTETENEKAAFARNMFIFSFITRGMATVDIAHLTTENISNHRLTYKRHKTEQTVTMEWLCEMQHIADKYQKENEKYIFPLIDSTSPDSLHEFKKLQLRLNYQLKKLGKQLNLPLPLTMYVARHSWATIAKSSGVPTAVISDAMGHNSEKTTQIYLDSIDEGSIDTANKSIVDKLFQSNIPK